MALITDLDPEVLNNIFHLLLESRLRDGLQILFALARTCRSFFEPAANSLWRWVPSLAPLAYLLPRDAWVMICEPDENTGTPAIITLRRALVPSDFARFSIYTHRVKELGGLGQPATARLHAYELSPDALATLLRHQFLPCLLPELRVLDMSRSHSKGLAPFIAMFFSPKLEVLTIPTGLQIEPEQEKQEFRALLCIPERCPRLSVLQVYGPEASSSFVEAIAKLVPHLKAIYTLRIPHVPMAIDALKALSNSSGLEQLTFYVLPGRNPCEAFADATGDAHEKEHLFSSLTQLSITLDVIQHATQFLAYVTSSGLSSLKVVLRQTATPEQLERFFKALSCHPSCPKLNELIIHGQAVRQDVRPIRRSSQLQLGVALSGLLPLLDLRLRLLEIAGIPVDIDDDDLKRMARAWPELRQLSLGVYGRRLWMSSYPPRATLFGLIPIFQYCRRIEMIGYRMRTDIFDEEATYDIIGFTRPGKGIITNNVVELCVGDSRIHEPTKVASFLSDICPRLWEIENTWLRRELMNSQEIAVLNVADEEDMYRKWGLVTKYVPEFVRIRQQERHFIRDK